jgi:hypothetical protein
MREWLDYGSKLFHKQSPSMYAPSLVQVKEDTFHSQTSLQAQLAKRDLYKYLDEAETILSDCSAELEQLQRNQADPGRLKRIADLLGRFSTDSDGWGFEDIYLVVAQLQHMVLAIIQGLRTWDAETARLTAAGLDLLQSLLHECERDYDRRLAVAAYLQSFAPDEVA